MILKLNTYKFGEKEIEVNNIEEAIILLNSYVDFHQIGASDMNCEFGYLYDKNNKFICIISYNGEIIEMQDRKVDFNFLQEKMNNDMLKSLKEKNMEE